MRLCIAWVLVLLPFTGIACESGERRACEKQFAALVSYRSEAIDYAFGNLSASMPGELRVKLVAANDPEFARFNGMAVYDVEHRTLIFPRHLARAAMPNPLRWAAYYWPYYESDRGRREFPVIEAVDSALWSAYLQESAKTSGLQWPHKECESVDVGHRLPCEMLAGGIGEFVTGSRGRIFNSNRLDRIWPEDFAAFRQRIWRSDAAYTEVRNYGGILLVRPLIDEFGVARALAYLAQTPFLVEETSMRVAAVRYQERARQALTVLPANVQTIPQPNGSTNMPTTRMHAADDARLK